MPLLNSKCTFFFYLLFLVHDMDKSFEFVFSLLYFFFVRLLLLRWVLFYLSVQISVHKAIQTECSWKSKMCLWTMDAISVLYSFSVLFSIIMVCICFCVNVCFCSLWLCHWLVEVTPNEACKNSNYDNIHPKKKKIISFILFSWVPSILSRTCLFQNFFFGFVFFKIVYFIFISPYSLSLHVNFYSVFVLLGVICAQITPITIAVMRQQYTE